MLKYTRSLEDSRGLHIEFGEPITPANFLAACNAAIDLAKVECSTQTAVAIVFEAQGVEVQVTETDSAEVQLALWERKMSNYIEQPERGQQQDRPLNTDPTVIEAKVMKDYAHYLGKDVLVNRICGYVGDDSTDIELSSPAKVRVEATSEQSLKRWIDGWCGPLYEVALVEDHPQVNGMRSLWIHGPSLHLNGKQTEASDIFAIAEPQAGNLHGNVEKSQDIRPIAGNPRLFIENLGYDIREDSQQPGLWIWTTPSDGCDISFSTAQEALDSAWNDAIAQTLAIRDIRCEAWGEMSFEQQKTVVIQALSEEGDAVQDVVDDVLQRAEKYSFTPDEDMVRDTVVESANLLNIELSEADIAQACERIMGAQTRVTDAQRG